MENRKISRDSWYYKVTSTLFYHPSKNLCVFFWQLAFSLLIFAAAGVVLSCMAAIVLIVFASILYVPVVIFELVPSPEDTDYLMSLMAIGVISWFIGMGFVVWKILSTSFHKLTKIAIGDSKEPNIVSQYISAKKNKICPRIDFVD